MNNFKDDDDGILNRLKRVLPLKHIVQHANTATLKQ